MEVIESGIPNLGPYSIDQSGEPLINNGSSSGGLGLATKYMVSYAYVQYLHWTIFI